MHPVRVSLQVVGSVETLSTQLALVGLLSGVSSAMFPVVFLRKELFTTKLATETIRISLISAMSYYNKPQCHIMHPNKPHLISFAY